MQYKFHIAKVPSYKTYNSISNNKNVIAKLNTSPSQFSSAGTSFPSYWLKHWVGIFDHENSLGV